MLIKEYFKLQFKMSNRRLMEFGVPPIVAYFVLFVLFFYLSTLLFKRTEYAALIYLVSGVTLFFHFAYQTEIFLPRK